jgi:hypothetical protein
LALAVALMVLGLSLVRPRTAPNERPSTA